MGKTVHHSRPPWWILALVVLVAAEVGLRIFVVGYRRWATRSSTSPTTAGEFRILCLGDSHTAGPFAALQDSFPGQLEQLLQNRWPERRFQVVNDGTPGFTSSHVLHRLEGRLEEVRPDFVLLYVGHNDDWNFEEVELSVAQLPWPTRLKIRLDQALSHAYLYRLAKPMILSQRNWGRVAEGIAGASAKGAQTELTSKRDLAELGELLDAEPDSTRRVLRNPAVGSPGQLIGEELHEQDVLRAQVELYMEQRAYDRALLLCEQLVEQDPANPELYLKLAEVQVAKGNLDEAIVSARMVLTWHPDSVRAYELLGQAFSSQRKLEQARAMFQHAVELNPSSAWVWNELAEVYHDLRQVELAREAWSTSFRLNHRLMNLVFFGRSYRDPEEARAAMRMLLEETKADSQHDPAYWQPHERVIEHGVHEEAVQRLLTANLQQIVDQITARGVPLGLLTYPPPAAKGENFWINEILRRVATRHPTVFLIDIARSLSDRFGEPTWEELMRWDKHHLNIKGDAVVAQSIMDTLVATGVLEASPQAPEGGHHGHLQLPSRSASGDARLGS